MLTILYAMICAAIAIRLATFNRNGGDYRPIPALLAWLLTVAAGSVPLRPCSACCLYLTPQPCCWQPWCSPPLIGSRGSVMRLLPKAPSTPHHSQPPEREVSTMTLRKAPSAPPVTELQQLLARAGYPVEPDGWFGGATEQAVLAFQRDHLIVAIGRAGPRTLAALRGAAIGNQLTLTDLQHAAERLGVELAKLAAFAQVEAAGEGFDDCQRPRLLFERHVFFKQLVKHQGKPKPTAWLACIRPCATPSAAATRVARPNGPACKPP